MAALPSPAPFGDHALDVVAARGERTLEALDEHAEIRIVRPRIHLRDEEDLHYDVRCCWSYVPQTARSSLQISPIVTRAFRASRIGGSRLPSPSATRRTPASVFSASAASRSART